ncbi:XrtA/PEP-CTERM system-associated ATPase [Aurantiacibacter suaedae]|uniref:XrtA/PEP-CTERM system-associated ATPase n=1 Tax=Aurantiacibacter suaedae TaxID=2545755 RepID=UPI0010F7D63A|nr:XrtA/PEP-CTERM system-associated ATPase [Aurantiacibacter suaedae]
MHDQFYGFTAKPFQLTPDPDFYFRSATHRKALSYLGYGLAQGEGFIVITGEIGAGKSTLVAHTIRSLDANQVTVAQVVTSHLDGEEIVHVVARAFGLSVAGHDKATALGEIEAFLHDEARAGRRCLLVVDESQNLSVSALEELRMLSNFQLGSHPLLQVLLLGQPEFRATLRNEPALEQLRQRIIAAHHLEPMQAEEVEPYVLHRLEKAGWQGNPQFADGVFDELYEASGGIPRKVNQIVNRVLMLGSLDRIELIDVELLDQVLAEMAAERAHLAPVDGEQRSSQPVTQPQQAPTAERAAPSAIDPQLIDDLLAERDVRIAELGQALDELAAKAEKAPASESDQETIREQIEELQHAVLDLSGQAEESVKRLLAPEIEAMRAEMSKLEARTFEQERTIRQTLSMLIEWIEAEMDSSKAA